MATTSASLLDRLGFDVALQSFSENTNEFELVDGSWSTVATIKAAWDTGSGNDGLKFEVADSETTYTMYVAYRSDLKLTKAASKYSILYNGVRYKIRSSHVIGDKVLCKLTLEDGFYDVTEVSSTNLWELLATNWESLNTNWEAIS